MVPRMYDEGPRESGPLEKLNRAFVVEINTDPG